METFSLDSDWEQERFSEGFVDNRLKNNQPQRKSWMFVALCT